MPIYFKASCTRTSQIQNWKIYTH